MGGNPTRSPSFYRRGVTAEEDAVRQAVLRALSAAFFLVCCGEQSLAAQLGTAIRVPRADNSTLEVTLFDRERGQADRALLIVTGSDCKNAASQRWIGQVVAGAPFRWIAVVEKDGASPEDRCGAGYEHHATEEARWFDTLAAMHALKEKLHLRNERAFQVLSISAGGLTGCAVAGATSDVSALALLSTGGGLTFAQEMAITDKDHPRIREQQGWVQDHPQIGRTWLGETNPEIWWWSALPKRCLPLLATYHGRVLVEQGDEDDAVPLASATSLVDGLKHEHVAVDFVRFHTGHDLGLSNLPSQENGIARALSWLAIDAAKRSPQ